MFGRGRFANRPYNVLISQGFPFQLRKSYLNSRWPFWAACRGIIGLCDHKRQQPRKKSERLGCLCVQNQQDAARQAMEVFDA